jgi:hypothetical protein
VDFIGTPTADTVSHIQVMLEFLNALWLYNIHNLKIASATGISLEKILRLKDWALAFLKISARKELADYISGWIVGHFIPTKPIEDIESKIRKSVSGTAKI